MKKYILSTFAILLFAAGVYSQTVPNNDLELMQRAQMIAEIKELRAENGGLKTQNTELKAQVDTYDKLNTVQESRIADLKEALQYRTTANNVDAKVEGLYQSQILDYKTENQRLRDENAGLRKSRDRRSLIMGVAGIIAGKWLF